MLKMAKGMEHSNQIREFVLTNDGLRMLDVYLGPEGVLTGSTGSHKKALVTFRKQAAGANWSASVRSLKPASASPGRSLK